MSQVIQELPTEHSPDAPAEGDQLARGVASRLLVPGFWATVSIVTVWLAVLFDGIFGGDMTFTNPPKVTVIPSAVVVALFAMIATVSVAKRAFGRQPA
jgi:hypothetical protein